MSVAGIINPASGTIRAEYLPTDPTPHPYVENPFQMTIDGGNQLLTDLGSLNIGGTGATPVGISLLVNGNTAVDGKLAIGATPYANYLQEDSTGNLLLNVPTEGIILKSAQGVIITPSTVANSATLQLKNSASSSVPTYYELYNASATGGGVTVGHLQLFGYSSLGAPTVVREILDIQPTGDNVAIGDGAIVGGCSVLVNGTLGASRVYDNTYNKPVVAQQVVGTTVLTSVPATGNPNPAKSIATFTLTSATRNSFTVYLKLNTGVLTTGDGTPYVFQYFLSETLDGNLNETKGCQVGYTPGISNAGSAFIPNTVLVYRSSAPITTLYLNIQSLQSTPHSGCQLANTAFTADIYASLL